MKIVPDILVINAYNSVFFYDVSLKTSRKFDDIMIFKATFSYNNKEILAIVRVPKIQKYQVIALNVESSKSDLRGSLEISEEKFAGFNNFLPCNIYQPFNGMILVAGVECANGNREITLESMHVLYAIKGNFHDNNNIQVKKIKLFSCHGYHDLFLESTMVTPIFKFLYVEER